MYKRSFLVICFIFILASCKKSPIRGGGCTPGPNNTHAFLTYTGVITQSTSDIFLIEFDKTHLSDFSQSHSYGIGINNKSIIQGSTSLYYLSDSGGHSFPGLFHYDFSVQYFGKAIGGFNDLPPNGISIKSFSLSPINPLVAIIYDDCPACARLTLGNSLGIYDLNTKLIKNIATAYDHLEWSKDGNKIYFDNLVNGIPHIFSINSDGTGLTQLTNSSFGEEYPALSPDGKTIAIASFMDAGHNEQEICFINPDGSNLHKITNLGNTTIAQQPCWSPLGDQFFFSCHSSVDNTIPSHIFSSNLDGSGIQQFTNGNGETFPNAGFLSMQVLTL